MVPAITGLRSSTKRTSDLKDRGNFHLHTEWSKKWYPGFTARQSAVLAIVNPSVGLSAGPSVRHTLALCQYDSSTIMGSSLEDSSMTLVSSWLTSARNSKGNIGSGGAE